MRISRIFSCLSSCVTPLSGKCNDISRKYVFPTTYTFLSWLATHNNCMVAPKYWEKMLFFAMEQGKLYWILGRGGLKTFVKSNIIIATQRLHLCVRVTRGNVNANEQNISFCSRFLCCRKIIIIDYIKIVSARHNILNYLHLNVNERITEKFDFSRKFPPHTFTHSETYFNWSLSNLDKSLPSSRAILRVGGL